MKTIKILLLPALCVLLTGCGEKTESGGSAWPWIWGILAALLLALAGYRTYQFICYRQRRQRRGRSVEGLRLDVVTQVLYGLGAMILLIVIITSAASRPVEEPEIPTLPTDPPTGWQSDETGRYYLQMDGQRATGWIEEDGKRYYLDLDGYTLSDWQTVDGELYYFRADGSMARGEVTIDGQSRFFTSAGKEIVMVNPWHPVPEGYEVELVELSVVYSTEGITVGKEMEADLLRMMDACNEQSGSRSCVVSGYRDLELQTSIFNSEISKLVAEGYTQADAEREAATRVALPGTSEHQMGLAVDINDTKSWDLNEEQQNLPAIQWLMAHCHEYGFILRYPNGKTDVTGIIYEPWHYRYVGTQLSMELHDLGMTLEEYIDYLD